MAAPLPRQQPVRVFSGRVGNSEEWESIFYGQNRLSRLGLCDELRPSPLPLRPLVV